MPWTPDRYPAAMQGLPPEVRSKAIAIANALLEQNGDEGRAIRIAIAAAKRWARRRSAYPSWATRQQRTPGAGGYAAAERPT